jgi:hypothetical protein
LEGAGVRVFYDQTELAVGDTFVSVIAEAVRAVRYLLVVMSPDYFASPWAASELQLGLSDELNQGVVKVIPLLRRDCEIPPLLSSKRWADFRTEDRFEESLAQLLAILKVSGKERLSYGRHPGTSVGQLEAPLGRRAAKAMRDSVNETVQNVVAPPSAKRRKRPTREGSHSKTCFVVMPFGNDGLTAVYEDYVRPTIKACRLTCERGDDVFGSNVVMDDIQRSIEGSRLVIADLTGKNANVFYEVGIAHAIGKPVLLMAQSMRDVPFDLRHRRVLVYEYTPRGCRKLKRSLAESIRAMLVVP